MPKKLYLSLALMLVFVRSVCQIQCGTAYKNIDLGEFQQSARFNGAKIALNVVVCHSSQEEKQITDEDINTIINDLNAYFKPIGFEFGLLNSGVKHIYNETYSRLQINDENALRQEYDSPFAINLYMVSSIVQENGNQLSGFTNLPEYDAVTNRITVSYLNRSEPDFLLLRQKVIPHEMGHYFGLLHTFQDSNHPNIAKRELVTRGPSANCSTTGDFLCDTPADPFDRLPRTFIFNCDSEVSNDILDADGRTFGPLPDNLMSYQINCGHTFTHQQYQRMLAGANIRFSPDAAYSIVENKQNAIYLKPLEQLNFCTNTNISIPYETFGNISPKNLEIQLSDLKGENFKSIPASAENGKILFSVVDTFSQGFGYRVKLVDQFTGVESLPSEPFQIKNKGSASLTGSKSLARIGDIVDFHLKLSGNGPWNVFFEDGLEIKNIKEPVVFFQKEIQKTTTFKVKEIDGACGILNNLPSFKVESIPPGLEFENLRETVCQGASLRIQTKGLKTNLSGYYKAVLRNGLRFEFFPSIQNGFLEIEIPPNFQSDTFTLQIVGPALEDYSKIENIHILPSPQPPSIKGNTNICYGQTSFEYEILGDGIKWYTSWSSSSGSSNALVNTNTAGKQIYYLSQTALNGCESDRMEAIFNVYQTLKVGMAGNYSVLEGDSVTIVLDHNSPSDLNLTLSNGFEVEIPFPLNYFNYLPFQSESFFISQVNNTCGLGNSSGLVTIELLKPLSIKKELFWDVYPNPSSGRIKLTKEINDLTLTDLLGQNVPFRILNKDEIDIKRKGVFILESNGKTRKIVVH